MANRIALHIALSLILCSATFVSAVRCTKEYSYERQPADTLTNNLPIPLPDTLPANGFVITSCTSCSGTAAVADSVWYFKGNGALLCGRITDAVLSPEKNAFTFFGPSACSGDTGLIITAYFDPLTFTVAQDQLTANRASLVYYDKNGTVNVFDSRRDHPFSLTIERFDPQTRIGSGRFEGYAVTSSGSLVTISGGRFQFTFRK